MTMYQDSGQNDVEIDVVSVGEIDGKLLSPPVHVQSAMKHLQLQPLIEYIQNVIKDTSREQTATVPLNLPAGKMDYGPSEGVKIIGGAPITRAERIADKTRLYNFSRVKKKRKWLKNILIDDSSDEEEADRDERIKRMMKFHKFRRSCIKDFRSQREQHQLMNYTGGILSVLDDGNESEFSKRVKTESSQQTESQISDEDEDEDEDELDWLEHRRRRKRRRLTPEEVLIEQMNIWSNICKHYIPSAYKTRTENRRENLSKLKKVSNQCMKECRKVALQSQKLTKESVNRAKKLAKEAGNYWRKKDRSEKETKRKTDKENEEQRKQELAIMEAQRQQRKLNFLITQTELYAHFMARKITGHGEDVQQKILDQLPEETRSGDSSPFDSKSTALSNAQDAYNLHASKTRSFATGVKTEETGEDFQQPMLFNGILKGYQLKGMNWLIRLYEEGLNGILADEMGLGKGIQGMAFLGHLAETYNIWGPFLIVAPASTLHNWQQEFARFLPKFKCVPYWGSAPDRKVLRKFWENTELCNEESSFHVVITSYQIVIQDVKYFQKLEWQYMMLDEAQAIKSSASARWKILLGFSCRNRLLLTGTPIQNNLAELWALLHFIMPTLFDCHEEFNEWFSKDLETQAEGRNPTFDKKKITRLHAILSPFMLRREKKEVEDQLSEKIEIIVQCPLTSRQKLLYSALKNKISIDDLLTSSRAQTQSTTQTNTLMNLVMQFRKVCNHPDLVDRRETYSGSRMMNETYRFPRLLYEVRNPNLNHVLYNQLYIHHKSNIVESLREHREGGSLESAFSFSRFVGLSPLELNEIYLTMMLRWIAILHYWEMAENLYMDSVWENGRGSTSNLLLLDCLKPTAPANVMTSEVFDMLVFTSNLMTSHGHTDHTLKSMTETLSHRRIRLRSYVVERQRSPERKRSPDKLKSPDRLKSPERLKSPKSTPISPSRSPARALSPSRSAPVSPTKSQKRSPRFSENPIIKEEKIEQKPDRTFTSVLTDWPKFTYVQKKKIHFPPRNWYCADRAAEFHRQFSECCGSRDAMRTLLYGSPELYDDFEQISSGFQYRKPGGLLAVDPVHGYSSIITPDKSALVTDAGKLNVLDQLLTQLKGEGHRVLIYSQMTRMIDILEEYMWHRKHTYIRLDGSSKISDRRDMVADFQSREDIFVFLLSTRAGGLGINLTAADTVIFYDSDWNPTVDAQAMDRAHRLGQTRQVTVYRLVTENSIEQRILERAKAKSQIQNLVMKGTSVPLDALKPTEVVSLLLDDDEMQTKFNERQKDPRKRGSSSEARRRADDSLDRESVTSSAATSPISCVSEHLSTMTNDNSNDALYIAEEVSQEPSPKRRGRPRGSPKKASKPAAAKLTNSSGIEIADAAASSRLGSLRTRSSNQNPNQGTGSQAHE